MERALILFTRVPAPGHAKTRMQSLLTPVEASKLQECMIRDIGKICDSKTWDTYVYYTPEGSDQEIKNLLPYEMTFCPQVGSDLGERMYHAIEEVLQKGYKSCILFGSDIPSIQTKDVESAFSILEDQDVVFGPTKDKGYYLVGMHEPLSIIFEHQIYGNGNVLECTLERVRRAELRAELIKEYQDLDEPRDLAIFQSTMVQGQSSYTQQYVSYLMEQYKEQWPIPV